MTVFNNMHSSDPGCLAAHSMVLTPCKYHNHYANSSNRVLLTGVLMLHQ